MKFLDQNGVLTLWNKIKAKFPQLIDVSNNGQKVDSSYHGISLYTGTNVSSDPGNSLLLCPQQITIMDSDNAYTTLSPNRLYLNKGTGNNVIDINTDLWRWENSGGTCYFTTDHSSSYEYAKPIQNLESLLV